MDSAVLVEYMYTFKLLLGTKFKLTKSYKNKIIQETAVYSIKICLLFTFYPVRLTICMLLSICVIFFFFLESLEDQLWLFTSESFNEEQGCSLTSL